MGFKETFIWGAAAASYQIEGAAYEDGKGLNIWDTFSHEDNKVYEKHNGDTACDHYHRLDEDLNNMSALGLKGYRFSVNWSRILPDGIGQVNESGIAFYNKLIDGLIQRGIKPCMTLYHWDLPYSLHLKGGWLNDESPKWFAEYAALIKERFGDRVHDFITLNEPQVFLGCGYYIGCHAPGYKLAKPELLRIGHNIMKAHGMAVKALRNGEECRIGIAGASRPAIPSTDSTADIDAAREQYFLSDYEAFSFSDAYWFDPIIKGKYPEWVYQYKEINAPHITDEDMVLISQPIDFIGMNIYCGNYIKAGKGITQNHPGFAHTANGWPVTPEALYWGPKFFYERYGKPIIITENGLCCNDWVSLDGKVHDENRIDFMHRYLLELKKAAEDKVEIDGYYTWSLIDNFEWAEGYKDRFGIIYVDYQTQERIIKDSGYYYKNIIESNGDNLN